MPFWSNNRFFIILRACFHITWTCSDLWVVENGGHFNFLAMKSQKGKQQIHVFNPKYIDVRNLDVIKALQTWFSVLSSATLKSVKPPTQWKEKLNKRIINKIVYAKVQYEIMTTNITYKLQIYVDLHQPPTHFSSI